MSIKHSELNIAIEKFMVESTPHYSHASLSTAYQNLQKVYAELKTPESLKKQSTLLKSDTEHLAYLLMRMPATYAVASHVLNEFFSMEYPEKIETLLDLGSGTGSILWAASDLGFKKVTAVDQSPKMIELAKQLVSHRHDLFGANIHWQLGDLAKNINVSQHDLVTLSYVLIEQEQVVQNKILEQAWSLAEQAVIIIEPGTPKGFSNCLAARDFFMQKGGFIAAPCTHHATCPMKADDWCHFAERIERSFWQKSFKKGALGYEDEPYSYLVVTKTPMTRKSSRVLKPPLKKSAHILLELCEADDVRKVTVSKKQGELFKLAKKAKWGSTLDLTDV
jgi:ribosomal protein RSM22 (predicted rRNA methylase)